MSKESSKPATKSPWAIGSKKAYTESFQSALTEFQELNAEFDRNHYGVSQLIDVLKKSEPATQSIFAASRVRYLQRGMILAELNSAWEVNKGGYRRWVDFYETEVQYLTNLGYKSEELCRGVWKKWLEASDSDAERHELLHGEGSVHEFGKSLKRLAAGDSAEPEPKAKPSAHDRIQKVRKQVGKQISATQVGVDSDDAQYEALVLAVQSALKDLEDYVSSSRPSEAVISAPVTEVPFDGTEALEEAVAVELEAAA